MIHLLEKSDGMTRGNVYILNKIKGKKKRT